MERTGYVGLFEEPLTRVKLEPYILSWLEQFGHVEQTVGGGLQVLTQIVRNLEDVVWDPHLQFRVLSGEQFCWIYITQNRRIIETSGLISSQKGPSLSHDVLSLLPECLEIIHEKNDRRLDELEAQGLM